MKDHSETLDKTKELHPVIFAVKQRNLDELERIFWDVSDPTSARYGQHLTRAEVAELTTDKEAEEALQRYLKSLPEVTSIPHAFWGVCDSCGTSGGLGEGVRDHFPRL